MMTAQHLLADLLHHLALDKSDSDTFIAQKPNNLELVLSKSFSADDAWQNAKIVERDYANDVHKAEYTAKFDVRAVIPAWLTLPYLINKANELIDNKDNSLHLSRFKTSITAGLTHDTPMHAFFIGGDNAYNIHAITDVNGTNSLMFSDTGLRVEYESSDKIKERKFDTIDNTVFSDKYVLDKESVLIYANTFSDVKDKPDYNSYAVALASHFLLSSVYKNPKNINELDNIKKALKITTGKPIVLPVYNDIDISFGSAHQTLGEGDELNFVLRYMEQKDKREYAGVIDVMKGDDMVYRLKTSFTMVAERAVRMRLNKL